MATQLLQACFIDFLASLRFWLILARATVRRSIDILFAGGRMVRNGTQWPVDILVRLPVSYCLPLSIARPSALDLLC